MSGGSLLGDVRLDISLNMQWTNAQRKLLCRLTILSSLVQSCSFMFSHVQSCSVMFSHVHSCSVMFSHVESCAVDFQASQKCSVDKTKFLLSRDVEVSCSVVSPL